MLTFAPMSVRTRFAPSPTGGLHLGGVRTALFSYLFAKKNNGQFVLRIEDTDQSRFVPGAEEYIINTLAWCGISADEGPHNGGPYTPYRQSERKANYKKFAEQLINAGHAYYAFDTKEELEQMREQYKTDANPSPQYSAKLRMQMKNSLSLSANEVQALLAANTPYVVRIKLPEQGNVEFTDLIRGHVAFDVALLDDKVLLKADGMPTYHLAVVVDDYEMKITHAFRGEEWLPSAPIHILLWQYLGWQASMPAWAHLPLILKPDGNGKLSKRDGERLGFPVFAKQWHDATKNETIKGFEEIGFLPEAFLNLLVMLGWNDGTDKEIFSLAEMVALFDIARVHKGGAKFAHEKAKWYNHAWINKIEIEQLASLVLPLLKQHGVAVTNDAYAHTIINLVKERCTLLPDFVEQSSYFFKAPSTIDTASIAPKWTAEKTDFFKAFINKCNALPSFDMASIEQAFKDLAAEKSIKPGELQLPMRIMLVGAKYGPAVFEIAALIGKEQTINRIEYALGLL
jgi:glutamyl-tRNA synthetase